MEGMGTGVQIGQTVLRGRVRFVSNLWGDSNVTHNHNSEVYCRRQNDMMAVRVRVLIALIN